MQDPLVKSVLGKYRIHAWIGGGGYGSVYLAYHVQQRYPVALKVLDQALARDRNQVARFLQEYQVLYNLLYKIHQNKNIVRLYDYGQDQGRYYIAVEYLDGGNLDDWLKRCQWLDPGTAVSVVSQVAFALDAAHSIHIVHRDVKPSNVLFDRRGRVALADFGIAKSLGDLQRSSGRTPPGACLGTPPYMSPEQIRGNSETVGRWSDIYSLGIMAYQMLCGRLPFERDNDWAVMHAHLNDMPPSPRVYNPTLPVEAERVLLWALNKSPHDRPPSAGAFATSLAAALGYSTAQTRQPVALPSEVRRRLPTGMPRQQIPPVSPPWGSAFGAQRATALVGLLLMAAMLAAVLWGVFEFIPQPRPDNPTPDVLPGGTLAFVARTGGSVDIALLQNGRVRRLVLAGSESRPAWSPDGRRLAFVTDRNGNQDIYTMSANGDDLLQLTDNPGWDSGPSWSPNGRQIVFDSNSGGDFDVYIMDADGGNKQRLTSSSYLEGDPAFSPDGKTIAYVSDLEGNYDVYLMDTTGRALHRLTTSTGRDSHPAWSPDGAKIAYECESGGRSGICVVNEDGSGRRQLIQTTSDCRHPTWSADGRLIVYTREDSSGWQLYRMNSDGSNHLMVSTAGLIGTDPAWRP